MSVSNIFGSKIDATKLEILKPHKQNCRHPGWQHEKSLLILKQNYPILHQSNLLLLISHTLTNWNDRSWKHLINPHMPHSSPNTWHPWSWKGTLYFSFRRGGIPSDDPISNLYQPTTDFQHKITQIKLLQPR